MDNNEPISHHDVEKLNEALARKGVAYLMSATTMLRSYPKATC